MMNAFLEHVTLQRNISITIINKGNSITTQNLKIYSQKRRISYLRFHLNVSCTSENYFSKSVDYICLHEAHLIASNG